MAVAARAKVVMAVEAGGGAMGARLVVAVMVMVEVAMAKAVGTRVAAEVAAVVERVAETVVGTVAETVAETVGAMAAAMVAGAARSPPWNRASRCESAPAPLAPRRNLSLWRGETPDTEGFVSCLKSKVTIYYMFPPSAWYP